MPAAWPGAGKGWGLLWVVHAWHSQSPSGVWVTLGFRHPPWYLLCDHIVHFACRALPCLVNVAIHMIKSAWDMCDEIQGHANQVKCRSEAVTMMGWVMWDAHKTQGLKEKC